MNRRLVLGAVAAFILVVLALLGDRMAPYDVDHQELQVVTDSGTVHFSPAPPTRMHPFGTDVWGYDLFTLMLHGLKYTLFVCLAIAVLRIGLGGLIGIALGMVVNKRLPTMQFGALGSMPVFILVYFITFRVSLNPTIGTMALIALQAGLIVAFGLPSVVTTFQAHTLKIRESEYVLAAQSMAASPTRIVFRHVLPQLFETVIAAVSAEMVSALTIVGQLAIFNVFIGGSLYTPDPPLFHSLTHEWAGLLGQARNMIRTQQWRLFFPLMGYLLVLISFHLLSDGVETAYRRRRRTVNYL